MQSLFILKQEPDEIITMMIDEHSQESETIVINLGDEENYDRIIELIDQSDKVITW